MLSSSVSYLADGMSAHEPALIYVAVHSVEVAFAGILPRKDVLTVYQRGFYAAVLGNHKLILVKLPGHVRIVEVLSCVDERLAVIFSLNELQKQMQRVAQCP